MLSFICVDDGLTAYCDGKPYNVPFSHPKWDQIVEALNNNDEETFKDLADIATQVRRYVEQDDSGRIKVEEGNVLYDGEPLHNTIVDRILDMMDEGISIKPMLNFLRRLMDNPSGRAVNELYNFLENKHLPITPDGCVISYKTVANDYYSKASGNLKLLQGQIKGGRVYNAVGEVIECRRNDVDDDHSRHCSYGLHVGALEYAGPDGWYHSVGDHVMVTKWSPTDAVSVPSDHDFTKLRVCKYEVVDEYMQAFDKPVTYEYDPAEDTVWEPISPLSLEGGEYVSFEYDNKSREGKVDEVRATNVLVDHGEHLKNTKRYRSYSKTHMFHLHMKK